jgi:hypothetical protein
MDTGDLNLPAYQYQLEQVNIFFVLSLDNYIDFSSG